MLSLPLLAVNGDRLNSMIDQLAEIGRMPGGEIRRLAFTPDDQRARQQVKQWMVDAGMTLRIDAAGNLIGRYEGDHTDAPVLATGSHIDTVPSGGKFDGVLGVLAGIEVVQILRENQMRLRHPIEVIVFTDEESSMVGSRAMAGTVEQSRIVLEEKAPDRYKPEGGVQAGLTALGGNWQELATARRSRADMAAFVELHVEQGAVLESQQKQIGVVQGVVGMRRIAITIVGRANHAGTTPMDMRKDALVAAAQVVLAVRDIALQMPSQPVATVGSLTVAPNAMNVVPGRVEMTVDMRDLSTDCLNSMLEQLEQRLGSIATLTDTEISTSPILCVEPTPAAPQIQTTIAGICQRLGLSYCHLPSRAGHDALEVGRITDMGMIFVPSQEGVSHSGDEYTSPEQCVQGANVLLHTLMELDRHY